MRVITLFVLSCAVVLAQEPKDEWERVYTGDDSIIEMNISKVTFGEKTIGRIKYRTLYVRPQLLKSLQTAYTTRNETIEFKCNEKLYRVFSSNLVDAQGHEVAHYEQDLSAEWKTIKPGGMMEKLSYPGCKLIARHLPSTSTPQSKATLKRRVLQNRER